MNAEQLSVELKEAGISFSGCNKNGIVWDTDGITEIHTTPLVAAVIAAHVPESGLTVDKAKKKDMITSIDGLDIVDMKKDELNILYIAIARALNLCDSNGIVTYTDW